MKWKDIKSWTAGKGRRMTEADWTMLLALFMAVWLLMVLRYMNNV